MDLFFGQSKLLACHNVLEDRLKHLDGVILVFEEVKNGGAQCSVQNRSRHRAVMVKAVPCIGIPFEESYKATHIL